MSDVFNFPIFGSCSVINTIIDNIAQLVCSHIQNSIRNIISWLPFRAIYDIPLQVLLNKGGSDTLEGLAKMWGMQLGWCVILGLAGILFWNHAVKKITVNGG